MDSKVDTPSISMLYQWIQRIEQITENMNTRLSAIERRLSNNGENDAIIPVQIEDNKSILILQETISMQQREIEELKEKIEDYRKRDNHLTMKIGKREVSLEITGIIGGLITFLIAALIFLGGKDVVISPVFLTIIGVILISSSIIKSFYSTPILKKMSSRIDRLIER
ncbi:MAG: hypothetical protein DRN12_02695 [Thermoplasmata archaeon]|nr:MAG: hypothetical protein DRN12_02695 [Thermoplasmata archaeon]HEC89140.1 hypothetical protein [Thermoplasmatales archaeon]